MAQGEMYRLRKKDASAMSALMCRAYRADPLVLALVPEESNRARFLPSVFEFLSRYGILYGEAIVLAGGGRAGRIPQKGDTSAACISTKDTDSGS